MRVYALILLLCSCAFGGTVIFDFEDINSANDLLNTGWEIEDGGSLTGTITVETSIVKSGTKALRIGLQDWVSFDTDEEFGTLDIWLYDSGLLIEGLYSNAYGPTWGLQKDNTDSWTYPQSTPRDYTYTYGIGAGLVHKSYLSSNYGYSEQHGQDSPLIEVMQQQIDNYSGSYTEQDILDLAAISHNGWGRQSWFAPAFLGGASPNNDWQRIEGWCHYEIKYETEGVVEIRLLQNGDNSRSESVVYNINTIGANDSMGTFDGTYGGGVNRLFIWGGITDDSSGKNVFGDIIVDDIVWTPKSAHGLISGFANVVVGDYTLDGIVNLEDYNYWTDNLFGNTGIEIDPYIQWWYGDFDNDGDVDIQDGLIFRSLFGNSAGDGDINNNGVVNIRDFLILKENYGQNGCWYSGDLNRDSVVDIFDFLIIKANYGNTYP